jgi:hypothetical protein
VPQPSAGTEERVPGAASVVHRVGVLYSAAGSAPLCCVGTFQQHTGLLDGGLAMVVGLYDVVQDKQEYGMMMQ